MKKSLALADSGRIQVGPIGNENGGRLGGVLFERGDRVVEGLELSVGGNGLHVVDGAVWDVDN